MADAEAYQAAVITCEAARQVLSRLDLPELLSAIEQAEALGPVLDPTLWLEKSRAMAEDKALFRAALQLATFKPGTIIR
jgi:hypothetical protein